MERDDCNPLVALLVSIFTANGCVPALLNKYCTLSGVVPAPKSREVQKLAIPSIMLHQRRHTDINPGRSCPTSSAMRNISVMISAGSRWDGVTQHSRL